MQSRASSISIIVTAYNIANYLRVALQSVFDQTPCFDQVVVVDDGSTDDTPAVVASFRNSRLCYCRQNNGGPGIARNTGIDRATGDYVYFMDGDDVLQPGFTRFVQDAIANAETTLDLLTVSATNFSSFPDNKIQSDYFTWQCVGSHATGRDALFRALETKVFPVCPYLFVVRRGVLNENEPLRFPDSAYEDEVFAPALFLRCKNVLVTNNAFYCRRLRSDSVMHVSRTSRDTLGYLAAWTFWEKVAKEAEPRHRTMSLLKAYSFYRNAVRTAAKARIGESQFKSMVGNIRTDKRVYSKFDYRLARVHRGLASSAIMKRARRLAGQTAL